MARSCYPRHGHRIAPAALGVLLRVPIEKKFLQHIKDGPKNNLPFTEAETEGRCETRPGQSASDLSVAPELNTLTLADLDESSWSHFPESTCRELAEEVLAEVSRTPHLPDEVANQQLPSIPSGLTLADLELEVRTVNCLISAGIHERPQDLASMTIDDILGIRGFWFKSLLDLLTSLEYLNDHPERCDALRRSRSAAVDKSQVPHGYPRPNQILVPQTLHEVFQDSIPTRLARHTLLQGKQLCDLDETVWQHVRPEVIGQLAGLIVMRASSARHDAVVCQRQLPTPPKNVELNDLHLDNRTWNCLEREGFAKDIQALGNLTIGQVLAFRGFGGKCLVDLLTALETCLRRQDTLDSRLTAEAQTLKQLPQALDISFSDPRVGNLLRSIDRESNTVGEMVGRLLAREIDPPDPIRVRQQIAKIRRRIEELPQRLLEEELIEIFLPDENARDRQIVVQYYGWDGKGGCTLEHLGETYGLSRERIRQVCIQTIKRRRNVPIFAPVFDHALAFIRRRIPCTLSKLQQAFDTSGITQCGLPITLLPQTAEFLGRSCNFEVVRVNQVDLVLPPAQVALPRTVFQIARRAAAHQGAAPLEAVLTELAESGQPEVNQRFVRTILEAHPGFCWLNKCKSWFRFEVQAESSLASLIDKILSVSGPISIAKLRAAIVRHRRSEDRVLPSELLLEYCRQMPNIRIRNKTVIANPPSDWHEVLAGVEKQIVGILYEHGPVLERSALEDYCTRAEINRFSFNAMLMASPVLQQYERSIYGLINQSVTSEALDKLLLQRVPAPPNRVLQGFGQTKPGEYYLAYRLSKAAIAGGVVTVPAAMKRQLRGKFTLRTTDGQKVGTLVTKKGCGWGLGPALRGNDAEPGDHMVILIDPGKREAKIHIGDESLMQKVAPIAGPHRKAR